MSIRGELNKSADYLRNARKAILGRGGEISLTAGLKDLPKAIYNIPSGASLAYQSDTSVSYQKIVPVGSQEFAQVTKIGGMTYKSKNQFCITHIADYDNFVSKQTDSSIELTIPAGTSNAYVDVNMDLSLLGTTPHTFTVYGLPNDIECYIWYDWYDEEGDFTSDDRVYSGGRFYPAEVYSQAFVEIYAPEARDEDRSMVLDFMLNEDSNATYTPYFEGLRDTKVAELVGEGAQLIPFPYRKAVGVPTTQDGVTFTVLEDGGISVVGIPTADATYILGDYTNGWQNILKIGETYTISGGKDKVIVNIRTSPIGNPSSSSAYIESVDSKSQSKVFPEGREVRAVGLYILPRYIGQEIDTVIYPMLNRGSTAAPYKPYRADAVDTLAIAEEIRAIEGYGRGVNAEYHNYIDGERKVFVQNTYRKIFDGTENWYIPSAVVDGNKYFQASLSNAPLGDAYGIMSQYNYAPIGASTTQIGWNLLSSGYIRIRPDTSVYPTADAWKAYLAQRYANGNPLVIEYALATPIETDISSYLPSNFISVEGGGAITFVNEFEQKAPSTINYIFKTEGE